jgi:hypothetical protein
MMNASLLRVHEWTRMDTNEDAEVNRGNPTQRSQRRKDRKEEGAAVEIRDATFELIQDKQ